MTGLALPNPLALIVVDVQKGFDDPVWGRRNNPEMEERVGALLAAFRAHQQLVVFVRHDSRELDSPLAVGTPGNEFQAVVQGDPDLLVIKHVHSAFYGKPDLDHWLQDHGVESIAICGIATDHCCETTARMAGDLGYATFLILDATRAFDRMTPLGQAIPAEQIAQATGASLHDEFATVVDTSSVLEALG